MSSPEFIVEKITGKRYWNGRPQVRVKWLNYPEKESTWEPQENIGNCIDLLSDFEAELYKKKIHLDPLMDTFPVILSTPAPPKKKLCVNKAKRTPKPKEKPNLLRKMPKSKQDINHSKLSSLGNEYPNTRNGPLKSGKTENEVNLFPQIAKDKAKEMFREFYEDTLSLDLSSEFSDDSEHKSIEGGKQTKPTLEHPCQFGGRKINQLSSTISHLGKSSQKNVQTKIRTEDLRVIDLNHNLVPLGPPNVDSPTCSGKSHSEGNITQKPPGRKITPRFRKASNWLERGLDIEKVTNHFYKDEKLFLVVQWKGMRGSDALLLNDIIQIYPQHIIKYMESLKLFDDINI